MDTMQTPNDALLFPQCFQKGLASRQIQNRCFQTIWDQESRQYGIKNLDKSKILLVLARHTHHPKKVMS